MTWAVVPVKPLNGAKSRLAAVLSPVQRRTLMLAMLEDVLSTLLAAPALTRVLLLSRDEHARALAHSFGASLLDDPAHDLNGALEHAARYAVREGAEALLIVPGDLPLLSAADIVALAAPHPDVIIAPSRDGGTSAMRLRPPDALPFLFGPHSCARHLAAARAHNLLVHTYRAPNATLDDIDTPDDLARLLRHGGHGATARMLRASQ
jgi:2-phospho-L-lactate/phosphoenolpyruvate guanylyltransferase